MRWVCASLDPTYNCRNESGGPEAPAKLDLWSRPSGRFLLKNSATARLADLVDERLHLGRRRLCEKAHHVDHQEAEGRAQQPAADIAEVEPPHLAGHRMRAGDEG